ncbi:hypothetical protein ACVDG3_18110 [Meridianimarinicoccus sp. RP-17]|uniref:hypothetical protein n=1 Tax=Meridianimarinicoccus zhengii TaxID=2056810 RepID=UPI000DACBAE4|nr:hypothetical protein [Phycocomes zhengii]
MTGVTLQGSHGAWAVFRGDARISPFYRDQDAAARRQLSIERTPTRTVRRCLCCGHPFASEGRGHRMCDGCRGQWDGAV